MNIMIKSVLAGLALVLSSLPAVATPLADSALGGSGELYVVRAGTYGQLFPGRRQTDPQNRVLVLEIRRPNQLPERQLIPGSANPDVEDSLVLYSTIYKDNVSDIAWSKVESWALPRGLSQADWTKLTALVDNNPMLLQGASLGEMSYHADMMLAPEPTTLTMVVAAGGLLVRRRRA